MQESEGVWSIHRHCDYAHNSLNFAFIFTGGDIGRDRNLDRISGAMGKLFSDGSPELSYAEREDLTDQLRREIRKAPDPVPENWPQPDIDRIRTFNHGLKRASYMFMDCDDYRILTEMADISVSLAHSPEIITARSTSFKGYSVIDLMDVENEMFNARVVHEDGLLKATGLNPGVTVSGKIWEADTFYGIFHNTNKAFDWWDF